MPDLKLDQKSVIKAIEECAESAVGRLRGLATSLSDDVAAVSEILADPKKLDLATSDAAIVIDFENNYGHTRNISLQLDSGVGGHVRLMNPLPSGKYRAIVIINKIQKTTP